VSGAVDQTVDAGVETCPPLGDFSKSRANPGCKRLLVDELLLLDRLALVLLELDEDRLTFVLLDELLLDDDRLKAVLDEDRLTAVELDELLLLTLTAVLLLELVLDELLL
jgi:hypothetical protein